MTSFHSNLGTTRREDAGSLTLSRPPSKAVLSAEANAVQEVAACGGNTQLMEARLCQLTSSIRALVRSNVDLAEALAQEDDPDFMQALEENKLAMRRQGRVAVALVQELQKNGCNIELEADLQKALTLTVDVIHVSVERNDNAMTASAEGGNTSATAAATATESSGVFL